MTPKDFKHWRKGVMRMSQKEAAEALGLKRRVVQYYEKGERDGDVIDIPKAVRLACFALAQGVTDYHGPAIGAEGVPPEPDAGTTPAPDEVAGSKARKKKKAAPPAPAKGADDVPPKEPDTAEPQAAAS
ncbi:helix-turn-helix domain-containing protein [Rhodospira trueperi]|uniref:Helix-turn-helix n=1 Tax=Rhodospira trueperi TaxID=69960 RepID=A0A1G7G2R7_9PROT|nr:helix-turn-helix transcriptional regulator [Rhodospira trueperi]SDE82375.1 Helix-turn-helix [Rhodospira trueperi]